MQCEAIVAKHFVEVSTLVKQAELKDISDQ
jgi:hypothetical protein